MKLFTLAARSLNSDGTNLHFPID